MRVALASLRGLLILLLALLLAGPQVVRSDENVEPDVLVVLVDRSVSLTVRDMWCRRRVRCSAVTKRCATHCKPQGVAVFGDTGLGRARQVIWVGLRPARHRLGGPDPNRERGVRVV